MNVKVMQVAPGDVVAMWPVVGELLQKAYDADPVGCADTSLDQLKALLVAGVQRLLIAVRDEASIVCVCTVAPVYYPNASVAFVTAAGGRFGTDERVQEAFRNWARRSGFTRIQAQVRPSVARLAVRRGYTEIGRIVDFDLGKVQA